MSVQKSQPKILRIGGNQYRCFVVGGNAYSYIKLFYDLGYTGAANLDEADFVLFTGGEDVSPSLYGERALSSTISNASRDEKEKTVYEEALKRNLPMVGICRGGQFLNVMNGGKMWQHVDGHTRPHSIFVPLPNGGNRVIRVTSTHHQMMIPHESGDVLATARESHMRLGFGTEAKSPRVFENDTEVVWYSESMCLCFQPHPEYLDASKECREYFNELLDNFVIPMIVAKQHIAGDPKAEVKVKE